MKRVSARGRIIEVLARLKERYRTHMHTALLHGNEWELLVATMLSAQSQDAQVNKVTPALFGKYRDVGAFARAKPSQLYQYVRTLGLYRSKSKNIIRTARILEASFGGVVPSSMEKLVTLPGVGRKTANVVLSNGFGRHDGIAIDTHCITVAGRLFLLRTKSAGRIERIMMDFVPRSEWGNVTNLFIALGREVCTARAKHCDRCVLRDLCPSSEWRGDSS